MTIQKLLAIPLLVLISFATITSCSGGGGGSSTTESNTSSPSNNSSSDNSSSTTISKWSLWSSGVTMLRGANLFQRRVYPDLDEGWIGDGAFGPPVSQARINELAALGANYINLSHPGLYTESPPYVVDETAVANLDALLAMAEAADLFVVITFRTGPGRNEFVITGENNTSWPESRSVYTVWTDADAQQGWIDMWRYTAERYRGSRVVVAYDLMCEPHPGYILFGAYEPEDYYPANAGSLSDWNILHPRIAAAIREADSDTPIMVGGMNWSSALWLPVLATTGVERTIYAIHQYEPRDYTHQAAGAGLAYPGAGSIDTQMVYVDTFRATNSNVPVAANEFGLNRFAPDAGQFMRDHIERLESRGINHALWDWVPDYESQQNDNDDFDIQHGPDPANHVDIDNDLQSAVVSYWNNNSARPSNTSFE